MIEIGLGHYLTLAAIIFTIGIIGIFLNRKNVIIILMSIELILLAVNINLVSFSIYLQNLVGQVFTMFILTVAAAEAAVGLAIRVIYYKNKGSINVEQINSLKGKHGVRDSIITFIRCGYLRFFWKQVKGKVLSNINKLICIDFCDFIFIYFL